MRATQLKSNLKIALRVRRPVIVWGKPGVGKSNIVAQIAAEEKMQLLDWRLCLMDAVDLRGIPAVTKDGLTRWNPPEELPRDGRGILFLDELLQAATATTNGATQLILDRRLGTYKLPEGWVVFAASNEEGDRAMTSRMGTHVANRFLHFKMEVHTGDWLDWAQDPANGMDPRVFAFIKYRPEMLHKFDPKSTSKAFASPRSWEFMSQVLREFDRSSGQAWASDEQIELAASVVGVEAATEFVGFLRIMEKLVSIDEILLNPAKAPLPPDASVTYAVTFALLDRADKKTLPAIIVYLGRVEQEFAFLFMKQIENRKPELMKTKEFIKWSADNHQAI